jgi:hypothetical protein
LRPRSVTSIGTKVAELYLPEVKSCLPGNG